MGFIPSWAIGVAIIIVAVQFGKAVAAMFRTSHRGLPTSDKEVEELRQALDTMQTRVAELEERVDFSERLLAKQREADRLGT